MSNFKLIKFKNNFLGEAYYRKIALAKVYDQVALALKILLQKGEYFSFTTDMWTSPNSDSYIMFSKRQN